MDIRLTPARLSGSVAAIPSKSDAHRALICAAFADAPTRLIMAGEPSEDMRATARCLAALGCDVGWDAAGATVTPARIPQGEVILDCGESGSTLRFLLPVAAAVKDGFSVTGCGRLPERPIGALCEAMEAAGCALSAHALPLTVRGRLQAGRFALAGNVSSQFITGLLLAAPLLLGETHIALTTALESRGYVDMTLAAMRRFGAAVREAEDGFLAEPSGYRSPGRVAIEGDWSNAAFWLAARALGHAVAVEGLPADSAQPDRVAETLLNELGAGAVVDVSQCPDLLPILAVRAAYAQGETRFVNAARLRIKESDRLSAVAEGLCALGATVEEGADSLTVQGGGLRGGCTVGSCGDHRLAMAWAIAALDAASPVTLRSADAVKKSYPAFWRDYERLGGNIDVL